MLVEFIEIQSLGLLKKEEGNIMVEEENNLRAEKIAPEKWTCPPSDEPTVDVLSDYKKVEKAAEASLRLSLSCMFETSSWTTIQTVKRLSE